MGSASNTEREGVWVPDAWHSNAPYSPGLRVGEWVFVSGATPVDFATGLTVTGGIEEQADRVLSNIQLILRQAGSELREVVKTTVYLTDGKLAAGMNDVYRRYFVTPYPARATIMVGPLARPEFLIEVEAIALSAHSQG